MELSHKTKPAHFNVFWYIHLYLYMISSCISALKEGITEHKVYLYFSPAGLKKTNKQKFFK